MKSWWNDILCSVLTGWRPREFTELAKVKTPYEQTRILCQAEHHAFGRSVLFRLLPLVSIAALVIFLPGLGGVTPFLLGFFLLGPLSLALNHVRRKATHRELRRLLLEDILCDGCDYDLTGNTTGRCPECGLESSPEQQHQLEIRAERGVPEVEPADEAIPTPPEKTHWAQQNIPKLVRFPLYPELRRFDTYDAKLQSLGDAERRAPIRHPFLEKVSLVAFILAFPTMLVFLQTRTTLAMTPLAISILLDFFLVIRSRNAVRIELRRMLNEGLRCHQCNDLLHGNTSGRCPECGAEIPAEQQHQLGLRQSIGVESAAVTTV
ncbi:MAG TPA: hypothetical protein P5081_01885 [Phycisphaerae bacterium]|nr:hypothetical protein [Phycisphaerae bacterium]HRW51605.1 hypothetical protein [Phycisphaerae bacterium]